MVGILAAAAALLSRSDVEGADAAAVARWWELRDDPGRAAALYRNALGSLEEGETWSWAARRYARLLKRGGARRDAVAYWRRLWRAGDRQAGIEIAKYLEHEARDLAAAAAVTRGVLASAPEAERPEVERRLARLWRKLERHKAAPTEGLSRL